MRSEDKRAARAVRAPERSDHPQRPTALDLDTEAGVGAQFVEVDLPDIHIHARRLHPFRHLFLGGRLPALVGGDRHQPRDGVEQAIHVDGGEHAGFGGGEVGGGLGHGVLGPGGLGALVPGDRVMLGPVTQAGGMTGPHGVAKLVER